MLKGISPLIQPDLLKTMACMGHGDELVLADAHFPAYSFNKHVIRADGLLIADLLEAIMPLFELDQYVPHPLVMMAPVAGDTCDPLVENSYIQKLKSLISEVPEIQKIERHAFYERTQKAFAVVITGDTKKYGNLLIKKGVISH